MNDGSVLKEHFKKQHGCLTLSASAYGGRTAGVNLQSFKTRSYTRWGLCLCTLPLRAIINHQLRSYGVVTFLTNEMGKRLSPHVLSEPVDFHLLCFVNQLI